MAVFMMNVNSKRAQISRFLLESNLIEGIKREPTEEEIVQTLMFLEAGELNIPRLVELVQTYQPDAHMRTSHGMDVRVGAYRPPRGGPEIPKRLQTILVQAQDERQSPYDVHCRYEDLHPFMDGNGRSGRALWAWMMVRRQGWQSAFGLPFLHRWYYQCLEKTRDA